MKRESTKLLLDTHVWIWYVSGSELLQRSGVLSLIEQAAHRSDIYVSAISVWEVGMLEAKGRISFAMDCGQWVMKALTGPSIVLAPLTPEIAIQSSRLPGVFHGDPADRIIAATALLLNARLITKDKAVLAYARQGHIAATSV